MRRPLYLYNSLTCKKEEFTSNKRNKVSFYTCGPTVYGYVHIGNLRSYVFADTIKRTLLANEYSVDHVMNITDVGHLVGDGDDGEDKIEATAKSEGKSVKDIADFYTDAFTQDLSALNIIPPDSYVKATENIKEQIKLIKKLEKNGLAYSITDGVYFDTGAYPEYKNLLGVSFDDSNQNHTRIQTNKDKKNVHDFALWKFSPKNSKRLQEWESPWGKGFPGWHIECSAMSLAYLSNPIDIHCGGIDHYTVHHPNEIAQAEGAGYKPFVNYWLHHEHLNFENSKMAKSEGNIIRLQDLENKGFLPEAYRYYLLNTHYRQKISFSDTGLQGCASAYNNLKEHVSELPKKAVKEESYTNLFFEAINDDLNTPKALGILWDALKSDITPSQKKYVIGIADGVFGLSLLKEEEIPGDIIDLARERDEARLHDNFTKADELREVIERQGYKVKDTPGGTVVHRLQ